MTTPKTCSSCKKLFDANDICNNLCEKFLAVEVVKHWLKHEKSWPTMSDENNSKDQQDDSSGILKFWNSIDIQMRRMVVGAVILITLYYLVSPLQQCKRERPHYWCYKNTDW